MDFITTRSMEVAQLALDGLYDRQRAIAANTANTETPGYQRQTVAFEEQLREMISRDDMRREVRAQNSMPLQYNPTSLDQIQRKDDILTQKFLKEQAFTGYAPEAITDIRQVDGEGNNNVNVEKEMMDMAKTGMQYNALATLETRMFASLAEVIKSGGSV